VPVVSRCTSLTNHGDHLKRDCRADLGQSPRSGCEVSSRPKNCPSRTHSAQPWIRSRLHGEMLRLDVTRGLQAIVPSSVRPTVRSHANSSTDRLLISATAPADSTQPYCSLRYRLFASARCSAGACPPPVLAPRGTSPRATDLAVNASISRGRSAPLFDMDRQCAGR